MLGHQERATICGYKLPTYFWFVVSGSLCDVIQALIDYFISIIYTLEWEKTTICWTLSYILSIAIRHSSHRLLVFGEYEGTYMASLIKTYMTYSSSIVLSMVTNHLLVAFVGLTHKQAWIITMLWTGAYNYFLLKSSWRSGSKEGHGISNSGSGSNLNSIGGKDDNSDSDKLINHKLTV
jgi:hypothetical protein